MDTDTETGGDANERMRPARDSVAAALDVVGDRWVFLILREAFFGVRRYDALRRNTGASPTILSGRLKRLVAADVFERVRYGDHKDRYEYRLTEKGRDLYPVIVMLLGWGDRWQAGPDGPPLALVHEPCRQRLDPQVVCKDCGEPVHVRNVRWEAEEEAE